MAQHRIVILGGYGVFGGIIATQIARLIASSKMLAPEVLAAGNSGGRASQRLALAPGDAELVIAGRNAAHAGALARRIGARSLRCDLRSPADLRAALKGASLVIHAAGPFNNPSHPVAQACLEAGAHYIDIADDPRHIAAITQLDAQAKARGLLLCAGVSATPAITASMVRALMIDGLEPERIAGAISPGNRNPRGLATITAILAYIGEPLRVTVGGQLVERYGWYNGETVRFPRLVGRRRVYTVDTPDALLFPGRFGAQTVTFKAGLELPVMGGALTALAQLRRRRLLPNLAGQARLLTLLSWGLYPFGSPRGALGVWVEGQRGGRPITRSLALVASHDGPIVAAAPAILLARRLLSGAPPAVGAIPCLDLVDFDELASYLAGFGIRAVWGDGNGWRE